MSNLRTLQEICKLTGVSRRAVQGYEKAGLVSSVDRNKYGHLLYGEKEYERIAKIKLYQELRFSVKEIKLLIDAPNHIVKEALEKQLVTLRKEKVKTEKLIRIAETMILELSEEARNEK